ncbi:MAG: hypothetical protein H0V57_05495 [Thermoleophilaceae bacterium]|nr:hypothetical protein [Thermoleophilaceae bacterium]
MERFSVEVSTRKVAAGLEAERPPAAGPCDLTNCKGPGSVLSKADRNPELRNPLDLSPLSED